MPCINPVLAVSVMMNDEDKHVLKFIPRSEIDKLTDFKSVYGSNEVFLLPCMKCKPCREAYAKDWAVRCTLEAKEHKFNYFLTLTYDDYHVARGSKADFTSFLKKLGYYLYGKYERPLFFACMERGSTTNRLHFHCILFLDRELSLKKPVKLGSFYHWSCDLLDKCWNNGFVDVTPFEFDCAKYVAKYSTKQGNCFMSRNLAKSYYLKNREQIVIDNFKIYGDFNEDKYVDIPKCFVRWFVEDHISDIDTFKLSKRKIQTLLLGQLIRDKHKSSEGSLLRDKIYLFLHNDRLAKERRDF